MQKVNFYAVRDNVTGDFTHYFNCVNDDDAIRLIRDVMCDSNHIFVKHQTDLSLYCFVSYDPVTDIPTLVNTRVCDLSGLVPSISSLYTGFKTNAADDVAKSVVSSVSKSRIKSSGK